MSDIVAIFVIGSLNMDLVIRTDSFPSPGETVTGGDFIMNPGGKGANQAVACASFGVSTILVGSVGEVFGHDLIQAVSNRGVMTSHIHKEKTISSGIAVITIAEDDNTIIVDPGANANVTNNSVDEALSNACAADILLLQMEIPSDVVVHALMTAKSKGMMTIFNPAPAKPIADHIWSYVDLAVLNRSETMFYTKTDPFDTNMAIRAATVLKTLGVKQIIITMGTAGSLLLSDEVLKIGAFDVNTVDTTAAGDTYIGGLASMLAKQHPIDDAMRFASAAAALATTKIGAQQSIPSFDDVIRFLEEKSL